MKKKKGKSKKEENSFVRMMSMFPEMDCIFIEPFDEQCFMVAGSPASSKTKDIALGMTMISSFEEAVKSGFKLATMKGGSKILEAKLKKSKRYKRDKKVISKKVKK